jgi:hypothetical protein
MLPVYHHLYDAKLILLTVPACVMLWVEGGLTGWLALLVNSAGFVLTGDLPWAALLGLIDNLHLPSTRLTGQIVTAFQVIPAPLILLVMGVFYLWVYARRCSTQFLRVKSGGFAGTLIGPEPADPAHGPKKAAQQYDFESPRSC